MTTVNPPTPAEAIERLREAIKWNDVHYHDCDTTGPISYPCDCTATVDIAVVLALIAHEQH